MPGLKPGCSLVIVHTCVVNELNDVELNVMWTGSLRSGFSKAHKDDPLNVSQVTSRCAFGGRNSEPDETDRKEGK